jgi:hypothetical protein
MRKIDDNCVGCTSMGLPCMAPACGNSSREMIFCDNHPEEYADYIVDGEELCEECAKELLKEVFNDLLLSEQAEALNISFEDLRI